jgi:hypothetical protein
LSQPRTSYILAAIFLWSAVIGMVFVKYRAEAIS